MKKWKEYMMLAVLCISMVGCGKKDSGSELLTEVQETVTPVEEVVKPEGEETPEGIRLHVYSGDESEILCGTFLCKMRITEEMIR